MGLDREPRASRAGGLAVRRIVRPGCPDGSAAQPAGGPGCGLRHHAAHNIVHLATAIGFAAVAAAGPRASIHFMRAFGVVYLVVGLLGLAVLGGAPEGHLLGVVHINQIDNHLHVGLAGVILAAGFGLPRLAEA